MEGKHAPDFSLPDQEGNIHALSDYKGRWVVLYFYPKDGTPGCTLEACSFRDERDAIAEFGNAAVIGVSKDSVSSHKKFANNLNLNFTLLSDTSGGTADAYASLKEKSMFGRKYMGIQRNTFIIDPKGNIVKEYLGVNPLGHAGNIIEDLKTLQSMANQ